jgi:hypothetical protein
MTASKNIAIRVIVLATALLTGTTALAGQREIVFPVGDGAVIAFPGDIGFVDRGRIGVVLGYEPKPRHNLFSFSVSENKVLDTFDLSAVLGLEIYSSKLSIHSETGLLTVASFVLNDTNDQKVVALKVDSAGHFSKLWAITFPSTIGGIPSTVFNEDGTKIYAFYKDAKPRLVMLRMDDGELLASTDLPDRNTQALLLFDKVAKRPIVQTDEYIHVFVPEAEGFQIEWTGDVSTGFMPMSRAAISQDGRFMCGYASSSIYLDPPFSTNDFLTLNLNSKEFHAFAFRSRLVPSASAVTFHLPTGRILVPYSNKVKIKKNGFTIVNTGSNLMDILQLDSNGAITQGAQVELPPSTTNSNAANLITPYNNVALSQSGAIGFISSLDKRIFSFDTLTGEIVNDTSVPVPYFLTYIYRPEELDVLVCANGTNKLMVLDINSGPVVTGVQVKSSRTIIKGANFLFGTRVQVNGEDLGIANRNPDNPGHKITIDRGRKDYPEGQQFSVVVTNRDGLRSSPVTFTR